MRRGTIPGSSKMTCILPYTMRSPTIFNGTNGSLISKERYVLVQTPLLDDTKVSLSIKDDPIDGTAIVSIFGGLGWAS